MKIRVTRNKRTKSISIRFKAERGTDGADLATALLAAAKHKRTDLSTGIAQELNNLSEELQSVVKRFRLGG